MIDAWLTPSRSIEHPLTTKGTKDTKVQPHRVDLCLLGVPVKWTGGSVSYCRGGWQAVLWSPPAGSPVPLLHAAVPREDVP